MSDHDGVTGLICDANKTKTILKAEYMEIRKYPLIKVGLWHFVQPTDAVNEISYAERYPAAAGRQIRDLKAQLTQRDAVIDKLPKCWRLVDGALVKDCPVVPGMEVWSLSGEKHDIIEITCNSGKPLVWDFADSRLNIGDYYSTEAAAAAARDKEGTNCTPLEQDDAEKEKVE